MNYTKLNFLVCLPGPKCAFNLARAPISSHPVELLPITSCNICHGFSLSCILHITNEM